MALDWGIYNAMKQQPFVEKRMQLEQANVSYLQQFSQLASQKRQQRLQSQQMIQQQMNLFNEVEVLERDRTELTALIQEEEQSIVKGIAAVGGDPYRYLNTGGLANLNGYYQRIRQSDELRKGLENKQKQQSYLEAIQDGKVAIPSIMDIEGERRIVTFGQQLDMYNKGAIDDIQWSGAQAPVKLSPEAIFKIPNPNNPLVSRNVTVSEFFDMLIAKGQNPLIAHQMAGQAEVGDSGLTSLKFGVDQILYREYAKQRMGVGGKGGQIDFLDDLIKGVYKPHPEKDSDLLIHQTYIVGNKVVDGLGALKSGESAFYEELGYSKLQDPGKISQLFGMAGLKEEDGKMYIDLSRSKMYDFPGAPTPIRLAPEGEGRYGVKRANIVYRTSGTVQKGYNDEQYNNVSTSPFVMITLDPMGDTEVNERFRDLETDSPIYKSGLFVWDSPAKGFERAVKETDEGVEVTMFLPIRYEAASAIATGLQDVSMKGLPRSRFFQSHSMTNSFSY